MDRRDGRFNPKEYRPRIIDKQIKEALNNWPGVAILGPRGCGKTWSACNVAGSAVYFTDRRTSRLKMKTALNVRRGKFPRLLDEWQEAEGLYPSLIDKIDQSGLKPGLFVLTGSSSVRHIVDAPKSFMRLGTVRMCPMTLSESGVSPGQVSLLGLLRGVFVNCVAPKITLRELAWLIIRGG